MPQSEWERLISLQSNSCNTRSDDFVAHASPDQIWEGRRKKNNPQATSNICRHYVENKCNRKNCNFQHHMDDSDL